MNMTGNERILAAIVGSKPHQWSRTSGGFLVVPEWRATRSPGGLILGRTWKEIIAEARRIARDTREQAGGAQ